MDYSNPIVMGGNFVEFLFVFIAAYIVLTPKLKLWQTLPICFIGLALGYFLTGWVFHNSYLARLVISYGVSMVPLILVYKDRLYVKLIYIVMVLLISALAEVLCMLLFPGFTTADYLKMYIIFVSVVFALLLAASWLFYTLYKKKKVRLGFTDRAALLLLPYSQVLALSGWIKVTLYADDYPEIFSEGPVVLVLTLLMCIWADWALLKTLKRAVNEARLQVENSTLTRQIRAQERYYSTLNDQFTTIRRIRHDISNHMYTISALIEQGKAEEASEYAGEYLSRAEKGIDVLCANPYANAFLHCELSELRGSGIEPDFAVSISEHTAVSDVDIITVLGNLLDNAREACTGLEKPVVRLRVREENGFMLFTTENPFSPEHKQRKQRIEGLERGIGSTVLQSIADKYNGAYTCGEDNGIYRASVSARTV